MATSNRPRVSNLRGWLESCYASYFGEIVWGPSGCKRSGDQWTLQIRPPPDAEGRGEKPHSWLFKLPRRAGKEEHGGEEHGVGEILAGAIARFARLGDPPHGVGPHCGCFHGAAHLVKIWHEWVRVGGGIFEWLLRKPCIVGFLHVGRKTLCIKAREIVVAGVLRGE